MNFQVNAHQFLRTRVFQERNNQDIQVIKCKHKGKNALHSVSHSVCLLPLLYIGLIFLLMANKLTLLNNTWQIGYAKYINIKCFTESNKLGNLTEKLSISWQQAKYSKMGESGVRRLPLVTKHLCR